jgi:hypothetical protein
MNWLAGCFDSRKTVSILSFYPEFPLNLKNAKATFEATAKQFAKPANPLPFPRLAPLTGNFVNSSLGKAVLTLKDDGLVIEVQATGAKFKLGPWDGDIFMATLMATDQLGPIVDWIT